SFEFAHAIDFELAGGIGRYEAPLAADAGVHFTHGDLADVVVPPLHLLGGVGQGSRKTRSGGAAISISLTMASRSGVTMAVGMCAPRCLVLLAARRFFRVFGLHKSFQAGQIGAPEDTVLLQPGINSFQRPRIQRVNAMATFPSLLDQVCPPQQAQMFGDCRT